MGKNHRHKKNLKADKAKVKLKVSKTQFLPKGLNETKANFKIKPIVLPEQFREKNTDAPLSKRKLNIKDLLNRINHYNENVRSSACEELTDMYKQFSEDIARDYLGEVISSVTNLMQDRERKVRNSAVQALNIILELTPSDKLEPFFKYFSLNMRCAMTHIDPNIQEDSLKFLDCFLVRDCGLISKTSEQFLPDFFTLISRLRSENKLGRTLTLNLGSKMTSVTWRIKVLSRLHAVLDLILKRSEHRQERILDFFADSSNTFPILKDSFFKVLEDPTWESLESNKSAQTLLQSHLSTLIPVFYDIWMEVVPEQKTSKAANETTYLNYDAAAILWSIVNTMFLLWKYIESTQTSDSDLKNIFVSQGATKFLNNLLDNFPYCQSGTNSRKKSKVHSKSKEFLEVSTDPNCVKENIIICYIYFVLNANFARNTSKNEMKSIFAYINKCLLTKNYINQSNVHYVIEFIKLCLLEKCSVWKNSRLDAREILENVIVFYTNVSFGERNKIKIFRILAEVLDNPYLARSPHYQSWLSTLPGLLCKPTVSDAAVEIILELARKNCTPLLVEIKANMAKIMENFNRLTIMMTKNSFKDENFIKRELPFIFYYVNGFECSELKTLLELLPDYIPQQDRLILKEHLHKCTSNCVILD